MFLTYVVPILYVEKPPEAINCQSLPNARVSSAIHSQDCIYNRQTTVEWKLSYLRCLKLSICVSKLHHSRILRGGKPPCSNAIIACLFNRVIDSFGFLKMDRFGNNRVSPCFRSIRAQNELSKLFLCAQICCYAAVIADEFFLEPTS